MKTRQGFVANSSSSSFTCDICLEGAEVYSDSEGAYYLFCPRNHSFCAGHMRITPEELMSKLGADPDNEYPGRYFYENPVPVEYCPICQMEALSVDDLVKLMLIEHGQPDKDALLIELKRRFPDYQALREFLGFRSSPKDQTKPSGGFLL